MNMLPAMPRAFFTIAAFLIAPFVAAFSMSFAGQVESGFDTFNLKELLGWTFVFYFYAALATLLLGLPGFLLFRRLGAIRWWSTTLAGATIGIVVFLFIDPRGIHALAADWHAPAFWGSVGALSAFVFWIVRQRGIHKQHFAATT